jgi:hypothetical protein
VYVGGAGDLQKLRHSCSAISRKCPKYLKNPHHLLSLGPWCVIEVGDRVHNQNVFQQFAELQPQWGVVRRGSQGSRGFKDSLGNLGRMESLKLASK